MSSNPQQITLSNPGPNPIRVTGGTAGTPVDIAMGANAVVSFSADAPLQITVLASGQDLAGGHGEGGP